MQRRKINFGVLDQSESGSERADGEKMLKSAGIADFLKSSVCFGTGFVKLNAAKCGKNCGAKFLFAVMLVFLMACSFVSCKKNQTFTKKSIVCTTFPHYDWVMNILGEKADGFDVVLLESGGSDLHNFQPTFKHMAQIADCDMFVYVGGESDSWVQDALKNARNKNMIPVNLMEVLGERVQEEEIVEGMEADEEGEEHSHGHHFHEGDCDVHNDAADCCKDCGCEDSGCEDSGCEENAGGCENEASDCDDEVEYDEHIWLSLKNAVILVQALCDAVCSLDAENADFYQQNAQNYQSQLKALDLEYEKTFENAVTKTILFGDRFPFRYLVDDYNLNYYAAFVGCSAETEASFKTVIFLAQKVDELGLNCVFTLEKSDNKIARTIIENTKNKNQKILQLNSLQSVTEADVQNGTTYLSVMKKNLEVLRTAFTAISVSAD